MNKNHIHVLSRGVIIDQDYILMAYDPRPYPNHYYELNTKFYYLPGGHVEFQESATSALIREIKEETGFDATIERFLGIVEHAWNFPGDDVCCHTHEVNLIFEISIAKLKSQALSQKEEHVAFKWVPIKSLKEIDLRPLPLKLYLLKWLRSENHDIFQSTIK